MASSNTSTWRRIITLLCVSTMIALIIMIIYAILFESKKDEVYEESSRPTRRSEDTAMLFFGSAVYPGDIRGEFILQQRLEFLGVEDDYVGDETTFLLAESLLPHSVESLVVEHTSFDLEHLRDEEGKDLSTFRRAFRIDKESAESVNDGEFHLNEKKFIGGHGEIWIGHKVDKGGAVNLLQTYVLKRMNFQSQEDPIYRCALREAYFGNVLRHDPRTTTLVSYFIHGNDYWLAFEDEGVSLQQLLYAVSFTPSATLLEPSAIWRSLRISKSGDESLKSILYQIISGVESLHSKGIVHRDIKPSNILINSNADKDSVRLLISDFSSAISEGAFRSGLYGPGNEDYLPSVAEESPQYMPPEVIFSCFDFDTYGRVQSSDFHSKRRSSPSRDTNDESCSKIAYYEPWPESYDIWSIGIVFAEMVLGTADVFSVNQRTAALIRNRLRNADSETLENTLILAAMAEFCIYTPNSSFPSKTKSRSYSLLSRSRNLMLTEAHCGVDQLARSIQQRDPLGIGYHASGIDLMRRLLQWDPQKRISLKDALEHAYFVGPYVSTIDGSEHMTPEDLKYYNKKMHGIHSNGDHSTRSMSPSISNAYFQYHETMSELEMVESQQFSNTPRAIIEDAFCNITEGIQNLLENDFANRTYETTKSLSFPARFHYLMNESWRGNRSICVLSNRTELTDFSFEKDNTPITMSQERSDTSLLHQHKDALTESSKDLFFECPKCKRVFSLWETCQLHIKSRKHGSRCSYVTPIEGNHNIKQKMIPAVLPPCLSSHSLLDVGHDPSSGWCDLQGRRSYLEDTHAIRFEKEYKFYGVFDGHMGNRVSKFVARHLQSLFHVLVRDILRLNDKEDDMPVNLQDLNASEAWRSVYGLQDGAHAYEHVVYYNSNSTNKDASGLYHANWKLWHVVRSLRKSFTEINDYFERNYEMYPNNIYAGTTATVVLKFPSAIVVGNVGDSRAVLCCDRHNISGEAIALPLTVDHTLDNIAERKRIESLGGRIEHTGEKLRVDGAIVVTRSLGDIPFGSLLSSEPDIIAFRRNGLGESFYNNRTSESPCDNLFKQRMRGLSSEISSISQQFIVLASDGLFDVMTNDEAVFLVCEFLVETIFESENANFYTLDQTSAAFPVNAFQLAAKQLAQEAYARGSSDNIGVCVINLADI